MHTQAGGTVVGSRLGVGGESRKSNLAHRHLGRKAQRHDGRKPGMSMEEDTWMECGSAQDGHRGNEVLHTNRQDRVPRQTRSEVAEFRRSRCCQQSR